jgi:hypothetical protein
MKEVMTTIELGGVLGKPLGRPSSTDKHNW